MAAVAVDAIKCGFLAAALKVFLINEAKGLLQFYEHHRQPDVNPRAQRLTPTPERFTVIPL